MKDGFKKLLRQLHLEEFARGQLQSTRRLRGRLSMSIGRGARAVPTYFSTNRIRKLHIGCGDHVLAGWLNTDFLPGSREVLYLDATRSFPFSESQFDYVFSEHMIEHITFQEGLQLLKECNRILKPGGKMRLATPDLMFLIDLCAQAKSRVQQDYIAWSSNLFVPEAPHASAAFVINNFFRDWGHRFIYDEAVLRSSMESSGFVDIRRWDLRCSDDAELRDLENEARMPDGFLKLETFVLEGSKPRP